LVGTVAFFRDIPAVELAEIVIRELVRRTHIDPALIDDVIFGQCYPNGEAPAIGRVAALDAGLGVHIPGLQLDRRCGSGLQAVIDSAMRVQTGVAELVIAGGAESMSQAEHYALGCRWGVRGDSTPLWDRIARGRITSGGKHHPVPGGMLETAENLRREFGITRQAQDQLALQSHARAVAAQKSGRFSDEIVPVSIKVRGEVKHVDIDEHPRSDVIARGLGRAAARASRDRSRVNGDRW
jgi:acetyl-CoA C-acetyltransferase